jgi:hypothetical protein
MITLFLFFKSNNRRHLDMQIKWFFYLVNKGAAYKATLKNVFDTLKGFLHAIAYIYAIV